MRLLKRWLSSIVDVRKGEVLVSSLMFLNIFLLLVTYYLLKPARDSIFITVSGAKNLPLVFIAIAVVVVPVITIYSRISRSLKLNQLINYTLIFILANLLILRWLVSIPGQPWIAYTFYIWVSIYGVLTTSQFWLLANGIYDATQAKRIFVLFSLGAILGATFGGEITNALIEFFSVSTENLLFFCMGFIGGNVVLSNWIWSIAGRDITEERKTHHRPGKEEKQPGMGEVFNDVKSSRYLLLIVAVIVMTMVSASFADYLLKAVAEIEFTPPGADRPSKDALSAFFGKYYGRVSLLSFVVQFFLSYQILRIFGVGGAIMFLPVSQILSATAMAIAPGIVTGVLVRGTGDIFKYSIDKTGRELLFLPIPLDVKKRVKVFVDVLVDRWFRGLAGAFLYLFTAVLMLSVSQISMVLAIIAAIWVFVVLAIRREYVNAFRSALDRGEIDPAQLTVKLTDAATVNSLINALQSETPRQVAYALNMLTDAQSEQLVGALSPLLSHELAEIRAKALAILKNQPAPGLTAEVEKLVSDPDPEVRIEAFHCLYLYQKGDVPWVTQFITSEDFNLQTAALGFIARYGTLQQKRLIDESIIRSFMTRPGEKGKIARALLCGALVALPPEQYRQYLPELLKDPSPQVVRAAISSIGQTRDRTFLPDLINFLATPHYREETRKALANFGERILGTLSDHLNDPAVEASIRRNIPRVLREIHTQQSVEVLMHGLVLSGADIRRAVLRALNRLRNSAPELNFDHPLVPKGVNDALKNYYLVFRVREVLRRQTAKTAPKPRNHLLMTALEEKLHQLLEETFRLLALTYPPGDMYDAYRGITSTNKTLRASGIEFLDNILSKEVKQLLMPILDPSAPANVVQVGQKQFGLNIETVPDALAALITGPDDWLRACAIFNLTPPVLPALKNLIPPARQHPNRWVREAAEYISQILEEPFSGPPKVF